MAWAQGQATALLDQACGPMGTRFAVHESPPRPSLSAPPKTGARIVVFSEAISGQAGCWLSNRVGIDGNWIGAACMESYISADIVPGKHRLCVGLQKKKSAKYTALYEFTAETGRVYYFRAQTILVSLDVQLEPVNTEEGHLLLTVRNTSESTAK
ncbi:MAG: hypothetical protein ACYDC6_16265 [Acidobacteriaceae bacterium]